MWHIYLDDGTEIAAQKRRPTYAELQADANDWGFTVYLYYCNCNTPILEVNPI